jgi:hypothetical protein
MTDAVTGYAVWPSGVRWIVLSTDDGWRTVRNRTPVAVPTDGGLVIAARTGHVAVGVLPFQQLAVSPMLTSDGTTREWAPAQLPSALAATSTALARSSDATWAVLADGDVVTSTDSGATWSLSTSSRQLDPSGAVTISGVGFPDGSTGFLTTSSDGSTSPALFVTRDGGRSWADSGLHTDGGVISTRVPCRIGAMWAVPVQIDDHLVVATASATTGPWTLGQALPDSGAALISCTPRRVVAGVGAGDSEQLYAAAPGDPWSSLGRLDHGIDSLAAISDSTAIATDADPSRMLDISLDGSVRVTELVLPDWVATVGGPSMRS